MADQINIALNQLLSNNLVSSAVTLGLSFYAYKAGPELPSFMEELFENVFFQIFVGFMVLYMNTQNVMLSLVVSVVFIYGMKMFAGIKEKMFGGNDSINIVCHSHDQFCKFVQQSNDESLKKRYRYIIYDIPKNRVNSEINMLMHRYNDKYQQYLKNQQSSNNQKISLNCNGDYETQYNSQMRDIRNKSNILDIQMRDLYNQKMKCSNHQSQNRPHHSHYNEK